jgi:transcriptional activator SPT7
MDLGTMTKKLKAVQYKSKQEFVTDLNLIWDNCLKYNANPDHFLRRHALFMRKETEKLVPLIPAIVIRDRAAVEAEERRLHHGEAEVDGLDESDDEPIISSRGRKAPGKKAKKGSSARKAPAGINEGSPAPDMRAPPHGLANGLGSNLKRESLRADSESLIDGSSTPPGTLTPAGVNGVSSHGAFNHHDPMEVDGLDTPFNGIGLSSGRFGEEVEVDDVEYKAWKQVTKKDRALVTAERHRLFIGNRINPDEPALLRTRSGMRRWLRKQKEAIPGGPSGKRNATAEDAVLLGAESSGETLAEGIEGDEERVLPDYYDPLSAVPDIAPRLRWVEDSQGQVQDPSDEFLRILPPGSFVSRESSLTKRIEDNMRQMQATRKICSKIGVVKQMQLQSQVRIAFSISSSPTKAV